MVSECWIKILEICHKIQICKQMAARLSDLDLIRSFPSGPQLIDLLELLPNKKRETAHSVTARLIKEAQGGDERPPLKKEAVAARGSF